jgi:bifunctional oligoribonuclease and PAP phosphatase NrnA
VDYQKLKKALSESNKIAITTHKSPDGDAIGSSLALRSVLQKAGFIVDVIVPDAFPKFLNWMNGSDQIIVFESDQDQARSKLLEADLIFALDYNRLDRVGLLGELISQSDAIKVMIDHHIDPDQGFDEILSDTSASSTAQLIFQFVDEMGLLGHLDAIDSACLYAGIMTDTGSFRFSSTSAETHRVVADLLDRGLRPEMVHQAIYDQNSFTKLKLMGHVLTEKMDFLPNISLAVLSLSLSEKNRFHYEKGDTEGLVNYGLSIIGAKVSVFMSEESGYVKFSFRSKGEVDVNLIAREFFNGGGHKNAAGGKLDGSLDSAKKRLLEVFNKLSIN